MRRADKPGFSLIELLIVITIVGILFSFAGNAWHGALIKQRRNEATMMLHQIAGQQEIFKLHHHRYADHNELTLNPPEGLGVNTQAAHRYRFSTVLTSNGFVVSAVPASGSTQQTDDECQLFSINESSRLTARTERGEDSSRQCWNL